MEFERNKLVNILQGVEIAIDDARFSFIFDACFTDPKLDESKENDAHDHAWFEIHGVTKGVFNLFADGKEVAIKHNEIMFLAPGFYHSTLKSQQETYRYTMGFEFEQTKKGKKKGFYAHFLEAFSDFKYIKIKNASKAIGMLKELDIHVNKQALGVEYRIRSLLTMLIFWTYDNMMLHRWRVEQPADHMEGIDEPIINTNFVLGKLVSISDKIVTLSEASEAVFLDKRQINRIMKKRYNTTFKQKQITVRIESVKKNLIETDDSIEKIAFRAGFTNLTSFYKRFKQSTGMTPKEYRTKYSKKR